MFLPRIICSLPDPFVLFQSPSVLANTVHETERLKGPETRSQFFRRFMTLLQFRKYQAIHDLDNKSNSRKHLAVQSNSSNIIFSACF